MAAAYTAGASNLPFGTLRGYAGVDLPEHNETIRTVTCPFTGEELTAVPAHRPDVGVIHAQRADRRGNIQLFGIIGHVLATANFDEYLESIAGGPQ